MMTSVQADVSSIYSVLDEITSPDELIYYLQTFVAKRENERIPASEKRSWLSFLDTLSVNFIQTFPKSKLSNWDALDEKRRLCIITLEAIRWTANHVDEIFRDKDNHSLTILWRLLNLLTTLQTWTPLHSIDASDDNTPISLRKRVLEVLRQVFKGFTFATIDSVVCKYILDNCIASANQLLTSLPTTACPMEHTFIDLSPLSEPGELNCVSNIELLDVSELYLALSDTVHIAALCFEARKYASSAPAYASREILFVSRRLLEELVSSDTTGNPATRVDALASLAQSIKYLDGPTVIGDDILSSVFTNLLVFRLRTGPKADWRTFDEAMNDLCKDKRIKLYPGSSCLLILELILQENTDGMGELIIETSRSTLTSTIKTLDKRTLESMNSLIKTKDLDSQFQALVDVIDSISPLASPELNENMEVEANGQNLENFSWRQRVADFIQQRMFTLDQLDAFSEDGSDEEYLTVILEQVTERLTGPSSPEDRLKLIIALKEFVCTLSHPGKDTCANAENSRLPLSLIPTYRECLLYLQSIPDHDANPVLLRAAQNTLAACLKHHNRMLDIGDKSVADMIRRGLRNPDRSTRLAAGRALIEYIQLLQSSGVSNDTQLNYIFRLINQHMKSKEAALKETTLITIGLLGKTSHQETLGKCLLWLFEALDQRNVLLRSQAYMQLVHLATYHKKTPYQLVSPYLREISIYIISLLPHYPEPLVETCRFLSKSTSEFLTATSKYIMPELFAKCNSSSLDYINNVLGGSIPTLYINSAPEVLTHIFLLEEPRECTRALNFLVELLNSESNKERISLLLVIKSSMTVLLAKLVITMGNSDVYLVRRAKEGLLRVEKCLADSRKPSKRGLRVFLRKNLMGIVTTLIDLLHDAYGRKSNEEKRVAMLGLNAVIKEVGSSISTAAPQVMAILQSTVYIRPLTKSALQTWYSFLTSLTPDDLGPHVGPTSAVLVSLWPSLEPEERSLAKQAISYFLVDVFEEIGVYTEDIVNLSSIPELNQICKKKNWIRTNAPASSRLDNILNHIMASNSAVAEHALDDLRSFMLHEHADFTHNLTSGDTFDPLVGRMMRILLSVLRRDGENAEKLRLLSYQCLGILGAADPDRFDLPYKDANMVVLYNYTREEESIRFAMHLIADILVGVYRSTTDMTYQNQLAFAIQELMKFCQFGPELVSENRRPLPMKVINRWKSLPKHVLETVAPLLDGRFALSANDSGPVTEHPVYTHQKTYRDWIQTWTEYLISRVRGEMAKAIFDVLKLVVRNVSVAHVLLPHIVLNIFISGEDSDVQKIVSEFSVILEDVASHSSNSSADKRTLSAQAVFMLMDHLNKWLRIKRQLANQMKSDPDGKTSKSRLRIEEILGETELEIARVDSILASINQVLVAKAAFQSRAYARSLMNFEKQIVSMGKKSSDDVQVYYEKLHEIYAHLDEPDGMEGVSNLITFPSIEHQIRQHESTGRWTSAQSCWEVRLQQSPDKLDYHLGLLRCLRNLGHYDSLRTHIQGVLVRNPGWEAALTGYRVEGAWMSGDWDTVQHLVNKRCGSDAWELDIAELLLSLRSSDESRFTETIASVRQRLGAPIFATGESGGYRRAYDSILKLHLVQDIEIVRNAISKVREDQTKTQTLPDLFALLSRRLDSTLPTFRTREPLLSVHRATYSLSSIATAYFKKAIGTAWLESAKLSRKAGHLQSAYSAVLQAQECQAPFPFYQKAKIVRTSGEPLRALHELENALKLSDERRLLLTKGVLDLTEDIKVDADEQRRLLAKAKLLCTRWKDESDRFDTNTIIKEFVTLMREFSEVESVHFRSGHFQDEYYKTMNERDLKDRGPKITLFTLRAFLRTVKLGSKYAYQAIPRLLTLWLDLGEDPTISKEESYKSMNEEMERAIFEIPVYKWMVAFPQIVSRVEHINTRVFNIIQKLIVTIILEYPQQALWLFISTRNSTRQLRRTRGKYILDLCSNNPRSQGSKVAGLVEASKKMADELLQLCNVPITDLKKKKYTLEGLNPNLAKLTPSPLIIPLQESMTVSLPPTSSSESRHQPFPSDAPTIVAFHNDVEVMLSLARPRKLTLDGSDGQQYTFLGKPKDDLRKDARLMEFNSIINKLLKRNSESRRRQLRIRTYSVITLNETCGFLQWVPNTKPIRPILLKYYQDRGIQTWGGFIESFFKEVEKVKEDRVAKSQFESRLLAKIPPIFHEWFLDTFPEPTTWLACRHAYGRTAAVMSMVGFILGLGDRHLENILVDVTTGDVVHVDFNCLFEKGKLLEVPERVPFRLTQNMVDALGVTGVEGVFRIASELSLQLLRDNKDILMSVLDTFIHDPLVEWIADQKKQQLMLEKAAKRKGQQYVNQVTVNWRQLGRKTLEDIEKKLRGLYSRDLNRPNAIKEIETSNLVQILVEEATDNKNLARMYTGWAPMH